MVSIDKAGHGASVRSRVGRLAAATTVILGAALGFGAMSAIGAPPSIMWTRISSPTTTSVVLEAELTTGGRKTTYHFEYDSTPYGEGEGAHGTSTAVGTLLATETPAVVNATVEGLSPGSAYHFRAVAKNTEAGSEVKSPDRRFATYAIGLGALPDERAYEQASPVDKNGGDVTGTVPYVKAAFDGRGITFVSTSGVPGGEGAQELPVYLANRSGEGSLASWDARGLLPAASYGDKARVLGWTPDFSVFFEQATKLGLPSTSALLARPGAGGTPIQITPYVPAANLSSLGARFAYAGSSADNSEAVFEANSGQLGTTPAGAEGRSNVYAWDGSRISLVSVLPDGQAANGAFAGPYGWLKEKTNEGGADRGYYTQDERAVTEDGSVFFTEAGSGHIYLRENPTQPQSALDPETGKCTEPTKACTIDVSPTVRAEPDPGGVRPRAFQAASASGQSSFFTSPEELTDDANTGPEVQEPTISRAIIGSGGEEEAEEVLEEFLTDHHAVGVAVVGEYLYWADAVDGTIGRARLVGEEVKDPNDQYVSREQIEVQREVEGGAEEGFAHPRYVAIGPCAEGGEVLEGVECVYWTNPADGKRESGMIGRAKLGAGEAEEAKPEFIKGASNPQGIAVNATHIYWANAFYTSANWEDDIARATIEGEEVKQRFFERNGGTEIPYGVALDATHVYFAVDTVNSSGNGLIERIPLDGGDPESVTEFIAIEHGDSPRGIALDGVHVYWAAQANKAIARIPLGDLHPNGVSTICETDPKCEPEFLKISGVPTGLALSPPHLYWSANGEIPPHPGNDLYRYSATSESLTDLTADSKDENGAEVQGVIGASKDGSRLYFVANADLDEEGQASKGNCNGLKGKSPNGSCNLYLWEAGGTPTGSVSFVARLDASGDAPLSDARDWLPSAGSSGVFITSHQRSSQLNDNGGTLLFFSQRKLTSYDNTGVPELYLFRVGQGITCVSCNPTAAPALRRPSLGSIQPSALGPAGATAVSSHNLADGGKRVFFQTVEPLVPEDENGEKECPPVGSELQRGAEFFSCLDVYEWEAPGTGGCTEGAPDYSPQDEGCLYLISNGKSDWASLLADASASGNDVFFFSREGLVGQDKDELLDIYDARVGGGIPSQTPPPPPPACESSEACHGPPPPPPPPEASPGSGSFVGPADPKPKRGKAKKAHHRKHHHRKRRTGR